MDLAFLVDSSTQTEPSDDFMVFFGSPMKLKQIPHEVALIELATWFTWFNVSSQYGNNIFRYSPDNGVSWFEETIPSGNYTIDQLQTAIHDLLFANGHSTIDPETAEDVYPINFLPNYSTIKLYIELEAGYQLDLSTGTLNELLGFDHAVLTASAYGPFNVNITNNVNTMTLHCSLVNGGSYYNNTSSDILFTFVPSAPPGGQIVRTPVNPIYMAIDRLDYFDRIRIRLTDQRGRRIDLNGEHLTAMLHIRPRKVLTV